MKAMAMTNKRTDTFN